MKGRKRKETKREGDELSWKEKKITNPQVYFKSHRVWPVWRQTKC